MTIEAVLFDYGGVFTPSPFGAVNAYAHALGAEPAFFREIVFGSYDTDSDHPWHRCERGEISVAQTWQEISAAVESAGYRFDLAEMFGRMRGDGVDRAIVFDVVRDVRARGLRTAIITNNVREYGDAWRGQLPADDLFDTIVDSSHVGVRKPNPAIYHIALERLAVADPSLAVFLDDYEGNVVAARNLGMHGIVVGDDPRPALAELAALLDRELGAPD
ncbi:MAG TPA: HAD family phosphatase [Acidimicrobiia bacterium]|nr:HAD family phosphatase [Acidimicrobiia bacterium]